MTPTVPSLCVARNSPLDLTPVADVDFEAYLTGLCRTSSLLHSLVSSVLRTFFFSLSNGINPLVSFIIMHASCSVRPPPKGQALERSVKCRHLWLCGVTYPFWTFAPHLRKSYLMRDLLYFAFISTPHHNTCSISYTLLGS